MRSANPIRLVVQTPCPWVTGQIQGFLPRLESTFATSNSRIDGSVANSASTKTMHECRSFDPECPMFSGRHFDRSVILLCVRWYPAYNLSLRDLEEMTAERGIRVDQSTIHRWVVRFATVCWSGSIVGSIRSLKSGMSRKRTLRFAAAGCTSTAPSTVSVTRSNSSSVSIATWPASASPAPRQSYPA